MQIDFSQAESWSFDREGIIRSVGAGGAELEKTLQSLFNDHKAG